MERHVQQWLGIGLHFLNPRRREKLNYMNDRNVAYEEATKKRIEVNEMKSATMDVRSDTQRQYQERTHPRINESDAGFQQGHGETIELVRAHDEER